MKRSDLDDEYAPRHAARQRAREDEQRRVEQRKALEARPIADDAELSRAVARLAERWGLKRKKER
jgi:hypothetical protein